MTILGQLDRVAYATGLDRIIFMKFQPRSFRWTPLAVIAGLVAGYVLITRASGPVGRGGLIGWLLFYGAFLAAGLVRVFGPRFRPTFDHPLDERELMVRSRAYALSGILLVGCAMLGCFYMGAADLLGLWRPRTVNDWVSLGFGFQACGFVVPTLIASWLEPRPLGDQDD